MGADLELLPLDCEPFYHGYGPGCTEASLVFAKWSLAVTDLRGTPFCISFYVTKGNGLLLLGNDLLSKSNLLSSENLIVIPSSVLPPSISREGMDVVLPTYTDENLRTFLHVVPSQSTHYRTYFTSSENVSQTLLSSSHTLRMKMSKGKQAKDFATKLHLYTHLSVDDMKKVCKRGGILTPILSQALVNAYEKCVSCKRTGRPLHSRKVSFRRVVSSFNDEVQLDFFFIKRLTPLPILHIVDSATSFSVTCLVQSRGIEHVIQVLKTKWIEVHGPPDSLTGDDEFDVKEFRDFLSSLSIEFKATPARRHNKTGVVESRNAIVRILALRLLRDAEFMKNVRNTDYDVIEILSHATYLANILHGGKTLSSFEQAKGYTPRVCGLPSIPITQEMIRAHHEQVARRAISRFLNTRDVVTSEPAALIPGTPIYFCESHEKGGVWSLGYVVDAREHLVLVSRNLDGHGPILKIAYEDVRLVPSSTLLQDLDEIELNGAPDPDEQFDSDRRRHWNIVLDQAVPLPPEFESEENGALVSSLPQLGNDDPLSKSPECTSNVTEEEIIWLKHPCTASLLSTNEPAKINLPGVDVGDGNVEFSIQKDIGGTTILSQVDKVQLETSEQLVLKDIKKVVGDEPVTERKLEFAPRWILDKAIEKERANYKGAYESMHITSLPRNANLVSSHHFFQVKNDGSGEGKLKLKCRLVPHGNRDKDKDLVRADSSTAQFPIIRLVLSVSMILGFNLASLDISGAYLQSGPINRDIYVRPPRSWEAFVGEVWKLLKPAYGIVESGRLWQIEVESWMFDYGFESIPGLPQLFVLRKQDRSIGLLTAKVVDDFLLAGDSSHIHRFNAAIGKRFKVGRFTPKPPFVFDRLHISVDEDGSIVVSMQEFFDTILPLDISRARRKQAEETCTDEELTMFQKLAGQLNYLGHGVLPSASFAASYLQQFVGSLKVKHLSLANATLNELRKLNPQIKYAPAFNLQRGSSPAYLAFSDASQGSRSYGQSGYISGIYFGVPDDFHIYHVVDWYSGKQSRVSFSSVGAEILAAAESADRSELMTMGIQKLFLSDSALPLVLTVDSLGLYSTITTLHEGKDYRLRPVVSRLRDSFENREIAVMQWIQGPKNLADALTKRNTVLYKLLNNVCVSGKIPSEILSKVKINASFT